MCNKLSFLLVLSVLAASLAPTVSYADNGAAHKLSQGWPIQLGTSGGNINDIGSKYCCSGTLGALVEDGVNQYILSNNHVLAQSNYGVIGDGISQPGMIDFNCQQADIVAFLSDFKTIRFGKGRRAPMNTVDAAIALVVDGAVDSNGRILDIGQISSETVIATIGLAVQKSGRTSGHTKGIVTDIGVTVNVGYSTECGGTANQTARFGDQILIQGSNVEFSTGGDSGSLIVEDVAGGARAVGLLFAGSSTYTVANPIDAVLNAFGVVLAGGTISPPTPTLTGAIAGVVTNSSTGAFIDNAAVSTGDGQSTTTDSFGAYYLADVPVGDQQLSSSADGFKNLNKTVTVVENTVTDADFALRASKGGRGKPKKAAIRSALKAKNSHIHRLLSIEGVAGAGVGMSAKGQPQIRVYLIEDSKKVKSQVPATLDGIAVVTVVTGTFHAY